MNKVYVLYICLLTTVDTVFSGDASSSTNLYERAVNAAKRAGKNVGQAVTSDEAFACALHAQINGISVVGKEAALSPEEEVALAIRTSSHDTLQFRPNTAFWKSAEQPDSIACGYYAAFNARALQDVVEQSSSVTQEAVMELCYKIAHANKAWLVPGVVHELSDREILEWTASLNVGYTLNTSTYKFIFGLINGIGVVPLNMKADGFVAETDEAVENFRVAKQRFESICVPVIKAELAKKESVFVIPFICHVPGHWVYIGLLKEKNQDPRLIILDSLNNRLPAYQPFVDYLYGLFFVPKECSICLVDLETGLEMTPCGHFFHKSCLQECKKKSKDCPMCRASLLTTRHCAIKQ